MLHEREQDIQRAIIEYLRLNHYVAFKHHSTGFAVRDGKTCPFKYGDRGISDIIACSPQGTFVAIEVKKAGGSKPSPEQIAFIDGIKKTGGVAFVARSLDDVIAQIQGAPARTLPVGDLSPHQDIRAYAR